MAKCQNQQTPGTMGKNAETLDSRQPLISKETSRHHINNHFVYSLRHFLYQFEENTVGELKDKLLHTIGFPGISFHFYQQMLSRHHLL